MNNLTNKWVVMSPIIILVVGTITSGVLFSFQNGRLQSSQAEVDSLKTQLLDISAEIKSLETQLSDTTAKTSSLESEILGLADLEREVSALALEVNVRQVPVQFQTELGIADVVAMVKPSVVSIDSQVVSYFFGRPITQEGSGSGWIIDKNGIIVTNYHVIEGAQTITVTLADGRSFTVDPATVEADQVHDLAILKIDAQNLPAVNVGDSSALRVGDWVVAIGNALGLGISAKEGIVSRLDVSLTVDNQTVDKLIEVSAAINPGNSGGPLLNMKGEVVGITSAKVSAVGVEGLGYAISIDSAMPIIEQLMAK